MIFASALSAAGSLAGSEHALVLVTCDRELLLAAEASGVQVLNPEAMAEAQ
jgi:predicted nucleic acid-binding protein